MTNRISPDSDPSRTIAPSHRRIPRPRLLAGGTLGLAGVGVAIALAVGGSTAAPALAVTKSDDGSVLVNMNYASGQNLPQVNQKLAAMGTGEQITIYNATGAAPRSGPVTCTAAPGVTGPTINVLVGADGTEVIAPGESAGNTAEGTFHLDHCVASSLSSSGGTTTTG